MCIRDRIYIVTGYTDRRFGLDSLASIIESKSGRSPYVPDKMCIRDRYTRDVYFIENEEIVRMTDSTMEFFTVDEEPIEKESTRIDCDINACLLYTSRCV